MGYKVKNKQAIIKFLILNTAFYIYGNIRLKEISIMNSFEQRHQARLFRLGSAARPWLSYPTRANSVDPDQMAITSNDGFTIHFMTLCTLLILFYYLNIYFFFIYLFLFIYFFFLLNSQVTFSLGSQCGWYICILVFCNLTYNSPKSI